MAFPPPTIFFEIPSEKGAHYLEMGDKINSVQLFGPLLTRIWSPGFAPGKTLHLGSQIIKDNASAKKMATWNPCWRRQINLQGPAIHPDPFAYRFLFIGKEDRWPEAERLLE